MKKYFVAFAVISTAIGGGANGLRSQTSSASSASATFEKHFLSSVPQHHQDAIDMAQVCTQKATHAELKSLCENIISSQSQQKQQLQQWLQSWYGGKSDPPAGMMEKMQAQNVAMMAKLNAASANEFDHIFLVSMGQHHAEGVPEFQECVAHARHPELKTLCGKMEASQKQQITQMNAWVKAWK